MARACPAVVVVAATTLALAAPARATVTSRFVPQAGTQGSLFVESDAADAIDVGCGGTGFVLVNGLPPQTGPLPCVWVNRIVVSGGPGDNRIDVTRFAPAQAFGSFRGVSAYAELAGGAGDDDVTGPANALVTLDGGPGNDRLEGRSIDRYVFGPATSPEVDTIVEAGLPGCEPSFVDSNQPGLSYWTVPWDAVDFTALAADDGVAAAGAAPAGIFARHRNRTVHVAGSSGIAIEAIAGGAGDDSLAGSCMTVGNAGDDRLVGTAADGDLALGGPGDDALAGAGGPDLLNGGPGADRLAGGPGPDALYGGPGPDALTGGDGGDVYLFEEQDGGQSDRVLERPGRGVDVLSFSFPRARGVTANLGLRTGVVASAGGTRVRAAPGAARNVEGLIGGAGNDRLLGHRGPNHFWSGGGVDLAAGGAGDDTYHLEWTASMPYGAYGYWEEPWGGPFDRGRMPVRPQFEQEVPASVVRVLERARGGLDTLDLAERFLSSETSGSRLQGQLDEGVRIDLSARRFLVEAAVIEAVPARPGGSAHIEAARGTVYDDTLIGNGAANVLEGRHGHDRVVGGRGRDRCLVYRREDTLRGCEQVRVANPDR